LRHVGCRRMCDPSITIGTEIGEGRSLWQSINHRTKGRVLRQLKKNPTISRDFGTSRCSSLQR
jgi:hypothetical protein